MPMFRVDLGRRIVQEQTHAIAALISNHVVPALGAVPSTWLIFVASFSTMAAASPMKRRRVFADSAPEGLWHAS